MSGQTLVVTVDGVDALTRHLDELGQRMADLRPVFVKVSEDFHQKEAELFASRGATADQPWAPSQSGSAVTMAGRRARLRRSLTVERANKSVQRITRNSLTLGSTHPLAHLHQGGTGPRYVRSYRGKPLAKPRYAGSLPRRVVFNVNDADKQRWRGMISDYVTATSGRLGL